MEAERLNAKSFRGKMVVDGLAYSGRVDANQPFVMPKVRGFDLRFLQVVVDLVETLERPDPSRHEVERGDDGVVLILGQIDAEHVLRSRADMERLARYVLRDSPEELARPFKEGAQVFLPEEIRRHLFLFGLKHVSRNNLSIFGGEHLMEPPLAFSGLLQELMPMIHAARREVEDRPPAVFRKNGPDKVPGFRILKRVLAEDAADRVGPHDGIDVVCADHLEYRSHFRRDLHLRIIS